MKQRSNYHFFLLATVLIAFTSLSAQKSLHDCIHDCLMYGAIGDARGNAVEFDTYRDGGFGTLNGEPVTTLTDLPRTLSSFCNGKHIVTDDTIMAEITIKTCLTWRAEEQPGGIRGLMTRIAQATLANHDLPADDYRWSGDGRAPGPTCINGIESFRK